MKLAKDGLCALCGQIKPLYQSQSGLWYCWKCKVEIRELRRERLKKNHRQRKAEPETDLELDNPF